MKGCVSGVGLGIVVGGFDRLADDDPAALDLLTLMAWLDPELLGHELAAYNGGWRGRQLGQLDWTTGPGSC